MLNAAGLGIAYNAKPMVRDAADALGQRALPRHDPLPARHLPRGDRGGRRGGRHRHARSAAHRLTPSGRTPTATHPPTSSSGSTRVASPAPRIAPVVSAACAGAGLDEQHSPGRQPAGGVRRDPTVQVDAVGAAVERHQRLVVAGLGRHQRDPVGGDVGRVGGQHVDAAEEAGRQGVVQVGEVECRGRRVATARTRARPGRRRTRAPRRARRRPRPRAPRRSTARRGRAVRGTGTHACASGVRASSSVRRRGHEHAGRDHQPPARELDPAEHRLQRLARDAPGDERLELVAGDAAAATSSAASSSAKTQPAARSRATTLRIAHAPRRGRRPPTPTPCPGRPTRRRREDRERRGREAAVTMAVVAVGVAVAVVEQLGQVGHGRVVADDDQRPRVAGDLAHQVEGGVGAGGVEAVVEDAASLVPAGAGRRPAPTSAGCGARRRPGRGRARSRGRPASGRPPSASARPRSASARS